MQLHDVHKGVHKRKKRKRIGRGVGSGHGKTSGKGHKGHSSRQGFKISPIFEGGQMPLARRVPKRGFVNGAFKKSYVVVNLSALEERFPAGSVVDEKALRAHGPGQRPGARWHQDPGHRRAFQAAGSARNQVQRVRGFQDRRGRGKTVVVPYRPHAVSGRPEKAAPAGA